MSEKRAVVRNASDATQVRRATETASRRRTREMSELREVAATQAGARVLWRILEDCGIHKLSWSVDPHRTSFNEGARNVGNRLLAELFEADPDAYLRMQKDAGRLEQTIPEPPVRNQDEDDGN